MNSKVKVVIAVVLLVAAVGLIAWYLTRGGSTPNAAALESSPPPANAPAMDP